MNIEFDMYQTLALAVLVLLLGSFLKKHIHFLEKFCIPAPVIGGLLFAILTCIGYSTGLLILPLMTLSAKYVWFFSLLRLDFRQI